MDAPNQTALRPDRRATGDRGAALVEFALLLPVFFMLVMGTFSAAVVYNDKASITQGAREAARYGATVPTDQCTTLANCGGLTWAQMVQSVAVERSAGSATTSDVCVALVTGSGAAESAIDSSHTTAGGTSPCWVDGSADASQRVQVMITRRDHINFLVSDIPVSLTSRATSKYEQ